MRKLKYFAVVFMLTAALLLSPAAAHLRSPLFIDLRSWLWLGIIVFSPVMIVAQMWLFRTTDRKQRLLRWLTSLGAGAAALSLCVALVVEVRFYVVRHHVLHADAGRLEKLGRHIIVGYRNLKEVRGLIKLRAVSGIFVGSWNVKGKSVAQVRREIDSLQQIRDEQKLPRLWISTDQEGGIVSRLSPPLSRLPGLSKIVNEYSDMERRRRAVREFALKQGHELAGIGVNLNFAPVVDINHQVINPKDKYTRIFQRAVSNDPAVTAQVAAWYCAALEETGVECTLKHFPGLGRVFEDTHFDHANLSTPVDELDKTDWVPFRTVMRQSKPFVMLGHARLVQLDAERPVSMSSSVISGLIRGKWNHDGILITDNFSMMAVYQSRAGIDEGSVDALNAGVDLILLSYDPDQYYRVMYALLKADEQGRLDAVALRKSDERLARAGRELSHKQKQLSE